MSVISDATDEINRQRAQYVADRIAKPKHFGHSSDGCWDGTHETGPACLGLNYKDGRDYRFRIIWCVHKHPWPFDYIYCIGTASDSRGERTDPNLTLDIRQMPKKYIGRYRLELNDACDRRAHRKVLERALSDGFDLATHVARIEEAEREEIAKRIAEKERRKAERKCVICGAQPVLESGYCKPCDDVPF